MTSTAAQNESSRSGYAAVNGLDMYYEMHGAGEPLVMLHGGMSTIGDFHRILPALAARRQVIAIERQGHGHTADIDRPFSFAQMADDTAALLRQLAIPQTDVFGYSAGGTVALELAIRHPGLVRKLVLSSTVYTMDGYHPEVREGLQHLTADALPLQMRDAYERVAPHPENWSNLVAKAAEQMRTDAGPRAEEVRGIQAPALVIVAERDVVRIDHAENLSRMLRAELVVLPESDHASYLLQRPDVLVAKLTAFLDAPMPAARQSAAR
jgi:pimeloyl-ACP methyl ester carboxylesterase